MRLTHPLHPTPLNSYPYSTMPQAVRDHVRALAGGAVDPAGGDLASVGAAQLAAWGFAEYVPPPAPEPDPVDPLAEGRAALAGANGQAIAAAVADFLGYCQALYANHQIAVLPGMTFQGIRQAVTARYPDVPGEEHETLKNMTIRGDIADELWVRWDVLCFHLGDLQTTERVVGQIVAIMRQQQ